jgi:L-galactose dehydrogenase
MDGCANIGYGCATLANIYAPIDDQKSKEIIEYCFSKGINYFDVAPFYGGGLAEKRLGNGLNNLPREKIFIATKIGRYTEDNSISGAGGYFDFSPSRIEQSIKDSLNNLNTNYLDLLQCHDIENVKKEDILDCLPLLDHFKSLGIINGIGINSYPIYPLYDIINSTSINIDTVGTYAHHTIINDSLLDYIPFFKKKNIKIINSSPLAMGLLSDKGPPDWHPASVLMKNVVSKINLFLNNKGHNLSQISMAYSLSNPDILCTLTGGNSIKEINENIDATKIEIPNDLIEQINKIAEPIKNKLWGPEEGIIPVHNWEYL